MRKIIIDLRVQGEPFEKGEIITYSTKSNEVKLKVIRKPGKRWYKILFELLTLGWYKAPMEDYKCKIIEK